MSEDTDTLKSLREELDFVIEEIMQLVMMKTRLQEQIKSLEDSQKEKSHVSS